MILLSHKEEFWSESSDSSFFRRKTAYEYAEEKCLTSSSAWSSTPYASEL